MEEKSGDVNGLFQGMPEAEVRDIEKMGCVRRKKFSQGEVILHAGDFVKELGIVESGSVRVENIDLWGNKSILGQFTTGQAFAETYVLCEQKVMVDVVASETAGILFVDVHRLMQDEKASWHMRILQNLLTMTSEKNLILTNRMFFLSSKTVRGRISMYLSSQATRQGKQKFLIPFSRQQMADYLNLDRSALSKELCNMRDEGLLKFYKNQFELLTSLPH